SFETIEHHDEREQMLAEIKRVLKPGGIVLVSSPDKAIYTDKPAYHNPFRVKELYRGEFDALFRHHFKNVVCLGQKAMFGSGIIPDAGAAALSFTRADLQSTDLSEARYNLVLASDASLPAAPASILEASDTDRNAETLALNAALNTRVRHLEAVVDQKETSINELVTRINELTARLERRWDHKLRVAFKNIRRKGLPTVLRKASAYLYSSILPFPVDRMSKERDTVIVLVHEATRTGAPILAWNLVVELQKRYNVVAVLRRGGAIEKAFRDSAAAVVCLPEKFRMRERVLKAVVNRLVKVYSPIFAIANTVETRYFIPYFERMGVPVIALVHEFSSNYRPIGTLNSLFETASEIVFPAGVVAKAATKDYRSLQVRDFKILAQGQSKLPPSADPEAPAKTNVRNLWPTEIEDSLLVVGMGSISFRKGIDFFISAAGIVHRAMPNRRIRFVWVGKYQSIERAYADYLDEQIERSALADVFFFMEEVEDLERIYDQADLYFLSSRLDPLPNVTIDSALRGIPVICFDQASGMAEILAEAADTRELIVPYLDAGAAAQLICDLAASPARLAKLSKAIRTVGEARFNMAHYVHAIDQLGRDAKKVLDQVKRDQALISENKAFNADLYLGISANTRSADRGLSRYLNASRLVAPRQRPRTGLFLRRPLEGFHPLIYASDNPRFDEASGEDPLAHYIRTGRPGGRWAHHVLQPNKTRRVRGTTLSIAVHGHFHHAELLLDFIRRLKCNTAAVDCYLTTTSTAKAKELCNLIAKSHLEKAKIIVVPNRGRDIGPMLTELGSKVLSGYDVVGHFHGKRSSHVDSHLGERWRNFMWEHLIGGEFAMMDVVLEAFAEEKGLGLVFAEDPHLNDWDDNRPLANQLAQRIGLALPLPNHFDFPIGGMFWARTAALTPLFDLGLSWDDYPEEPVPIDGTILHALERLVPFSADKAGFYYATTYVKGSMR
ncbi:MAG: rhamnan synthesis F family protein, partial [Steroidobacteraceae bacterium]